MGTDLGLSMIQTMVSGEQHVLQSNKLFAELKKNANVITTAWPIFILDNTPKLMLMRNQCPSNSTCDINQCYLAIKPTVYPNQPNKVYWTWINTKHHQFTTCKTDYWTLLITGQNAARRLIHSLVPETYWLIGYTDASHSLVRIWQPPRQSKIPLSFQCSILWLIKNNEKRGLWKKLHIQHV